MNALVTGHRGFVGRHVAQALSNRGWNVYGCDIADGPRNDCRRLFAEPIRTHLDLVVHCAAVVGGRATIEGAPLAVAVDLAIDADLFRWAVRARPGRIVYYSSSAAYPVRLQRADYHVALREDMIDLDSIETPDLTYGWSKLSGEMLAGHARAQGIPVTVLRPFSGYGTDQALDYPFPAFIDRARRLVDPFVIWGDGTQTRDWVHIDDVVAVTLLCVDEAIDGPLNIGTGRSTSFFELQKLVCAAAGYAPAVEPMHDAPAGVPHRVSDPARLLDIYTPKVTLEEGIDRALRGAA